MEFLVKTFGVIIFADTAEEGSHAAAMAQPPNPSRAGGR